MLMARRLLLSFGLTLAIGLLFSRIAPLNQILSVAARMVPISSSFATDEEISTVRVQREGGLIEEFTFRFRVDSVERAGDQILVSGYRV